MGHFAPPSSFADPPEGPADWARQPDFVSAAAELDDASLLVRYEAIACEAHALMAIQFSDAIHAPAEVIRLLEDAMYRLGLYLSAMPGEAGASLRNQTEPRANRA